MSAGRLALRQVRIDLSEPFVTSRGSWSERHAIELRLTSPTGGTGQGEVSPLPDYSPDDFDRVRAHLAAFQVPSAWFAPALTERRDALLTSFGSLQELPSARFALETALWDLTARERHVPLYRLLEELEPQLEATRTTPPKPVALSSVLNLRRADWLAHARSLLDSGIETFKIKIGTDLDQELENLRALRFELGAAARLRVDANASLDLESTMHWLAACRDLEIELLEEPGVWPTHTNPSGPELALDETLQGQTPEALGSLLDRSGAGVIVLKPAVLGGLLCSSSWARAALAQGARVIVSHLMDGPTAFAAYAHLALCIQSRELAAGLGPHAALPRERLPSWCERGWIQPPSAPGLGLDGERGNP